MIEVSGLTVYPLKGGRGISIAELSIDSIGPRHDRRWVVVDAAGVHVTQRDVARLCQVVARPDGPLLRLSAPYAPTLEVLTPKAESPRRRIQVWDDGVDAIDAGDEAARWISDFLGAAVRLVHCPDPTNRRTDSDYDPIGSPVSFADGYPLLLVSEASLADLNGRLALPLPMNRFRPNLVVRGTEPFAEDAWRRFTIRGIRFDVVKPCARCLVTTTDQDLAVRGHEPLRTLATYRKRGEGVMFGMNVVHRGTGTITVGDQVTIDRPA
jgi:MOSC domain-containing protein